MSANDLADAVDAWAEADESNARNYSFVSTAQTLNERAPDLRAAAVLLRRQAEQLDTLRNAIAEHRESALCNGSMFVADRERDLWDALDALAAAGGGVPETKENNDG